MNTREIVEEYRLSHWAQIMHDRVSSGMSIRSYCKLAGFHENVYYYWQRKLRKAALQDLSPKPLQEAGISEKALMPSGWAICKTAAPTEKKALVVEIGECRVHVESNFEPELFMNICLVLKSIC
jgi:putative transposase